MYKKEIKIIDNCIHIIENFISDSTADFLFCEFN